MCVVNHHTASKLGTRMNINAKNFADTHLNEICDIAAALLPKPMAKPVCLNCLKPFEEQQRLQQPVARWITVKNGHEIRTRCSRKVRLLFHGIIGQLAQNLLEHFRRCQFHRNPVRKRTFQTFVMKDATMDQSAHKRLSRDGIDRFGMDAVPNRVN
jgi:hypothetical protein